MHSLQDTCGNSAMHFAAIACVLTHSWCHAAVQESLDWSGVSLPWDVLCNKVQADNLDPGIFDACVWPALAAAGWSRTQEQGRDVFSSPAAAGPSSMEPSTISSVQDVLSLLGKAGQPVPARCVLQLRQVELETAVQERLADSRLPSAPHRHPGDPSGKQSGTHRSTRKLVSVKECRHDQELTSLSASGQLAMHACHHPTL